MVGRQHRRGALFLPTSCQVLGLTSPFLAISLLAQEACTSGRLGMCVINANSQSPVGQSWWAWGCGPRGTPPSPCPQSFPPQLGLSSSGRILLPVDLPSQLCRGALGHGFPTPASVPPGHLPLPCPAPSGAEPQLPTQGWEVTTASGLEPALVVLVEDRRRPPAGSQQSPRAAPVLPHPKVP